ncbi:MAG: hypothetical protein ACYS6K_27905, partial [Planctomycetota bacterium]
FLGSAAVEIVTAYGYLNKRPYKLPERYKKLAFWCVRLLLSLLAGGLALAYEIDSRILAMNVGAATPLIIQTLARNMPT